MSFLLISSLVLFFIVLITLLAPTSKISYAINLAAAPHTYVLSVAGLSNYNQQILIYSTCCSSSKSYLNISLQGFDSESAIEGYKISRISTHMQFSCEKELQLSEFVEHSSYILKIDSISDVRSDFELVYSNPDYINYEILIKGLLFQVVTVALLAFILKIRRLPISLRPEQCTYVILITFSCIFSILPYKLPSIQWNLSIWPMLETIFNFLFLLIIFGYFRLTHLFGSRYYTLWYFLASTGFVFNSVTTYNSLMICVVCLISLLYFYCNVFIASFKKFYRLETWRKRYFVIEVAIIVFLLVSGTFGGLRSCDSPASVNSFKVLSLAMYVIYLLWVFSFSELVEKPDLGLRLKVVSEESEMIMMK